MEYSRRTTQRELQRDESSLWRFLLPDRDDLQPNGLRIRRDQRGPRPERWRRPEHHHRDLARQNHRRVRFLVGRRRQLPSGARRERAARRHGDADNDRGRLPDRETPAEQRGQGAKWADGRQQRSAGVDPRLRDHHAHHHGRRLHHPAGGAAPGREHIICVVPRLPHRGLPLSPAHR